MLNKVNINILLNNTNVILSHQINYWFKSQGPSNVQEIILPAGIFILIFMLGLALAFYNRFRIGVYPPKNKIFIPFSTGLIILGVIGFFFVLFRILGVSFLGTRFFLLIILLAAIIWSVYFGYIYFRKMPGELIIYEAQTLKKKYLTKK